MITTKDIYFQETEIPNRYSVLLEGDLLVSAECSISKGNIERNPVESRLCAKKYIANIIRDKLYPQELRENIRILYEYARRSNFSSGAEVELVDSTYARCAAIVNIKEL